MITDGFDANFEHLADKKVQVFYKGEICVGYLSFAGINPLHKQYQVTLDRTPLWPVDPNTIKPYIEREKIVQDK